MENKPKKLEEIKRERRRRISLNNIFKENKKISILINNKINNKTPIHNSQYLNKNSIFP